MLGIMLYKETLISQEQDTFLTLKQRKHTDIHPSKSYHDKKYCDSPVYWCIVAALPAMT